MDNSDCENEESFRKNEVNFLIIISIVNTFKIKALIF